jgi:antitoxin (DNA-binding transcriptional repressor) of toxin-antitoxin stability system
MKEVKIAELKAGLSAHLDAVRKGEVVIVYDGAKPVTPAPRPFFPSRLEQA